MILEEEKLKLEKEGRERRIAYLRGVIEVGKAAERLSVNPDWVKLRTAAEEQSDHMEKDKAKAFDAIVGAASTPEARVQAVEEIRLLNCTLETRKYFFRLPEEWMVQVKTSEEELKKLEKDQEESK